MSKKPSDDKKSKKAPKGKPSKGNPKPETKGETSTKASPPKKAKKGAREVDAPETEASAPTPAPPAAAPQSPPAVEPVEREGRSVPRFERVEGAPASGFVSVLDLQLEAAEKEAASLSAKLDAVRQFAADMLHGPDCHARDHNDCGPVYCANGGTDEVCAKEQAACNCGVLRLRELLAGEARPTIPAEKGGA